MMGKTDSWIQYFLQVAQMFLVILISVDCGLVWLLKDPKTHVRTNRLDCRILSRAQLEGLEVQALEPEFLMKIPSNGGVTKALKDTAEKRKKMLVAYRDVQNNFQLLMKYQKSFSPPILLNIKETVGYINLLNRFWLEEMLAIKLKHRSVQIEPIGNLAKLNGSDFWINAIKKIIWANLKNLTTIAALDYPMEIIFSRLMLSAVECLLQQSFITNKESLELFRNERALDLLENKIKNVFYQTWNFNSLVFSIDFVNSLVKHPELCTVTSILHSLQATEIKHIIKFVLRSFSELYRFKQLIETSQMDRLIESYETLTNVNYDMEDWFKEHNNFNYINNIQQVPESYLYNLFTFHTLETHVKFNPEKLSKLVMNEIVTYRKNFNNIQSFQGRYIQKVYKTMESMLNFAE